MRLGLGPSTVSAHIKTLEDELGHRLFDRLQGGMVPTTVGYDAYLRFRPLLAQVGAGLRHVRARGTLPPAIVRTRLPADFPGTPFDAALTAAAQALEQTQPHLCVLAAESGRKAGDAAFVSVHYAAHDAAPEVGLRDRWIVVRASALSGWCEHPLELPSLAGTTLLVPRLPNALRKTLAALSEQAAVRLHETGLQIGRLLSQSGQFPNFCALVPAGLLADAMRRRHFEFAPLACAPLDPIVVIDHDGAPELASALWQELARTLAAQTLESASPPPPDGEMLSLKHTRSFLALYEEGNVGRAAQRLCVVQPALTVQLRQIEERLGGPLFARTHQGLRANVRADALYRLLRPLVEELDATVRDLRATGSPRPRQLRVGLMPALDDESLMTESFVTALEKWRSVHGAAVPQVVEAYSNTLLRWVHEGRVDFAVIDQIVSDTMLEVDSVATDSMAVVVGASSKLLPNGPVALRDIAKLPLVLPSSRHGLRALLSRSLKELGLTLVPTVEVDSMAAALRFIKVAPYATILPLGSVYKSRRRRQLRVHEICEPRITRHICLARARREPSSPDALQLMAELRSAFRSQASFLHQSARAEKLLLAG
jgi:DNA-binding transcriptional LysR family regulator